MSKLLDFYTSRFGAAVKKNGSSSYNGPCPMCGGEAGKSDRFVVWPERSENLGETCSKHGLLGVWTCRQCGLSGDTIEYLLKAEGMSFKQALGGLGIADYGQSSYKRRPAPQEPQKTSFAPKQFTLPHEKWLNYASKILTEAQAAIEQQAQALGWLKNRGLPLEAIKNYGIGYLPGEVDARGECKGRWRYRSGLGLEPKQAADGRMQTKIFIPRGIVIPTFLGANAINLRFRRHKEDLGTGPKYLELAGSCSCPLLLESSQPAHLAVYVIVEAELDAMLIHYATKGQVGALAVRTNRGKPDAYAVSKLKDAVRVLVALDYDEAGSAGVDWWSEHFTQAKRWPTPAGKDPGEAYSLGVDIAAWIAAGLPSSIKLTVENDLKSHKGSITCSAVNNQDICEKGREDLFLAGQNILGEGVAPENSCLREKEATILMPTSANMESLELKFTTLQWAELQKTMPPYLAMYIEHIPENILRMYLAWSEMPLLYVKEQGYTRWYHNVMYSKPAKSKMVAFMSIADSEQVFLWLFRHKDEEITSENFLDIGWDNFLQFKG